jgi:hypothetical protein
MRLKLIALPIRDRVLRVRAGCLEAAREVAASAGVASVDPVEDLEVRVGPEEAVDAAEASVADA